MTGEKHFLHSPWRRFDRTDILFWKIILNASSVVKLFWWKFSWTVLLLTIMTDSLDVFVCTDVLTPNTRALDRIAAVHHCSRMFFFSSVPKGPYIQVLVWKASAEMKWRSSQSRNKRLTSSQPSPVLALCLELCCRYRKRFSPKSKRRFLQ